MHHRLSRQTLTSVGDNATPVRSAGAAGLGRTLSANAAYGLPQSVCRFITQKTKTVVCEGLAAQRSLTNHRITELRVKRRKRREWERFSRVNKWVRVRIELKVLETSPQSA